MHNHGHHAGVGKPGRPPKRIEVDGIVATAKEHAARLGISLHSLYRRMATGGALAPHAPTKPARITVDGFYLSLSDGMRLILGACILTDPRMSFAEASRILGLSRQAVEQAAVRIRVRAAREGVELPPPTANPHDARTRQCAFRRAAYAKLGARALEARTLSDARVILLGTLRARVLQEVRWCPVCKAWRPIGEFHPSSVRTGKAAFYCVTCHRDYYQRRWACKPWGVCVDCLTEPVVPDTIRCTKCAEALELRATASAERRRGVRLGLRRRIAT